jgi:hypothetical protein
MRCLRYACFGRVAFLAILACTAVLTATSLLRAEPLDMKELVAIAKRHRLPMPPEGARLVLAHTHLDPNIDFPAFLLEKKKNGNVVVLSGTERLTLEKPPRRGQVWRDFSWEALQPTPHLKVSFRKDAAFVCVVQLAARGDQKNAQIIWERYSASEWVADVVDDPHLFLGRCIFRHLEERLPKEPEGWRDTHARMKVLFDEFPKLKTSQWEELFRGLGATIDAKQPAKDTVEATLLDWALQPLEKRNDDIFEEKSPIDGNLPAREIIQRGFAVVADLIALRDDRRVTTHMNIGRNNPRPGVCRVGELADELLSTIAGSTRPNGRPGSAEWKAWWANASGQTEKDFFARAVFRYRGEEIDSVYDGPARILAFSFPEKLPALCEEFSKHASPDRPPFALANALATARLPKEARTKALSEFAQRGFLEHRRRVLQVLAQLDAKACTAIVTPLLAKIPNDAKGEYWTSPEASVIRVVMLIEDDEVWREFLRVAKLASVELRVEMMEPMCYSHLGDKNRGRRLAFLAAFLSDEAVRDNSDGIGGYFGPAARYLFSRIAVRDFAAKKIASIFEFEDEPTASWTPEQWAKLREKVQLKLANEKLPKLD